MAMNLMRFALALWIAKTVLSDTASAFFIHQKDTSRRIRAKTCRLSANISPTVLYQTPSITSEEVRSRNLQQLEKLRERDRHSKEIQQQVGRMGCSWTSHEKRFLWILTLGSSSADFFRHLSLIPKDLKIVFEDEYIVCVDKPSGVLCVPSEEGIPTLAQAVFQYVNHTQSTLDKMVVHRLGMDTSGLVIFAKTMESLRGLNTLFRSRQITRTYEVLVCGHVAKNSGTIDMPLMRDYIHPPFMRVSTDEHQKALLELDPSIVGKKLLEHPKPSQTKYEVISRETLLGTDLTVTRLLLTSMTGRTHQLNVHCAAFGHPIVGDRVYGLDGDAAPNGGLDSLLTQVDGAASVELQKEIAAHCEGRNMCVHAKSLSFQHPVKDTPLSFESKAPF